MKQVLHKRQYRMQEFPRSSFPYLTILKSFCLYFNKFKRLFFWVQRMNLHLGTRQLQVESLQLINISNGVGITHGNACYVYKTLSPTVTGSFINLILITDNRYVFWIQE
jgi:hypothetical protein